MARYIDAEALRWEWLENGENEYAYDTNAVLDSIDEQPTADVVPMEELEHYLEASGAKQVMKDTKEKVAREIFAEIEKEFSAERDEYGEMMLFIYAQEYDELKKKYTEDE